MHPRLPEQLAINIDIIAILPPSPAPPQQHLYNTFWSLIPACTKSKSPSVHPLTNMSLKPLDYPSVDLSSSRSPVLSSIPFKLRRQNLILLSALSSKFLILNPNPGMRGRLMGLTPTHTLLSSIRRLILPLPRIIPSKSSGSGTGAFSNYGEGGCRGERAVRYEQTERERRQRGEHRSTDAEFIN